MFATAAGAAAADLRPDGDGRHAIGRPSSGDADFDELMADADAWDQAQKDDAAAAAAALDVEAVDAETAVYVGADEPTDAQEGDIWVAPMDDEPPSNPIHIVNVTMHHTAAKTGRDATPAQQALLARLIAERDPLHPVVAHATVQAVTPLTTREASTLIDALMAVPADPTRKAPRPNNYDGACRACGGTVAAGAGRIEKVDGRWRTFHLDGDCLTAEARAALEAERITEPGLYKHVTHGSVRSSPTSTVSASPAPASACTQRRSSSTTTTTATRSTSSSPTTPRRWHGCAAPTS